MTRNDWYDRPAIIWERPSLSDSSRSSSYSSSHWPEILTRSFTFSTFTQWTTSAMKKSLIPKSLPACCCCLSTIERHVSFARNYIYKPDVLSESRTERKAYCAPRRYKYVLCCCGGCDSEICDSRTFSLRLGFRD